MHLIEPTSRQKCHTLQGRHENTTGNEAPCLDVEEDSLLRAKMASSFTLYNDMYFRY